MVHKIIYRYCKLKTSKNEPKPTGYNNYFPKYKKTLK